MSVNIQPLISCFKAIVGIIWGTLSKWVSLIVLAAYSLLHVIASPSFVFFMFIALGLSTMGIWIELFPSGYDSGKDIIEQVEKMSVFTFSIATLGSIATAYFFENKGEGSVTLNGYGYPRWIISNFENNPELLKHSMFFLWSASVLSAFFALSNKAGIYLCLSLTFLMWAVDNLRKPIFRKYNPSAKENLTVDYDHDSDASASDSEILGGGL